MHCLYHTDPTPPSLYSDHICDRAQFPCEVLAELDKHGDELWQVRFSHDGTRLASCGLDKYVIIWDVASLEILVRIEAHQAGKITDVSWSPDDRMIVSCSGDNSAKVWNTEVCARGTGGYVLVIDSATDGCSGQETGCVRRTSHQLCLDGRLAIVHHREHGQGKFDMPVGPGRQPHPHVDQGVQDDLGGPIGGWAVACRHGCPAVGARVQLSDPAARVRLGSQVDALVCEHQPGLEVPPCQQDGRRGPAQ